MSRSVPHCQQSQMVATCRVLGLQFGCLGLEMEMNGLIMERLILLRQSMETPPSLCPFTQQTTGEVDLSILTRTLSI